MTVIDTPDWSNPLPGGSRLILNDSFNLLTLGGNYVSGWMDVNAFSGIYIETNGFDLATDWGTMEVQFRDASGVQPILVKYDVTWRGDLPAKVNVPVLGAQARVVITGPAHNVNAAIIAVGHGGGPSSSVRNQSRFLVGVQGVNLGAGVATNIYSPIITEGPAFIALATGGANGVLTVNSDNANGVSQVIAQINVTAPLSGSAELWLPPQPCWLQIANTGAGPAQYWGGLSLGRT